MKAFRFTSNFLRKAHAVAKRIRKTSNLPWRKIWALALRETYLFVRRLRDRKITIVKHSGEVVTRYIAPVGEFIKGRGRGGSKAVSSRFFCIDLERLSNGMKPEACLISFYNYQIV